MSCIKAAFQFCFWRPLPVNGGFLSNHMLIIIDHRKLCWRSLCSSLVGPLWNITVLLCLSGMRGNLGLTAAVLTVMSVLTFSLMSLLCLWCKRKSSKCVYYRLDRGDCSWYRQLLDAFLAREKCFIVIVVVKVWSAISASLMIKFEV